MEILGHKLDVSAFFANSQIVIQHGNHAHDKGNQQQMGQSGADQRDHLLLGGSTRRGPIQRRRSRRDIQHSVYKICQRQAQPQTDHKQHSAEQQQASKDPAAVAGDKLSGAPHRPHRPLPFHQQRLQRKQKLRCCRQPQHSAKDQSKRQGKARKECCQQQRRCPAQTKPQHSFNSRALVQVPGGSPSDNRTNRRKIQRHKENQLD